MNVRKKLYTFKLNNTIKIFLTKENQSKTLEDVFLVRPETIWVRARNELHHDCPLYLMPSWERACSQIN
jgi:hypothetical protein